MSVRSIRRQSVNPGAYSGTANAAPIYVDSDDNILKVIPAGSGTTEVQVVDASSTQTLTNKTLTSPTITGATLTSPVGAVAAEIVTTTNVIAAAESNTTFILNSATAFVSTLPTPALGLRFKFVIGATPPSGGNHTVVTTGATNIIYGAAEVAGAVVAASAEDSINFIDGGLPGDYVEVVSDGTNYYVTGQATTAAKLTFTAV